MSHSVEELRENAAELPYRLPLGAALSWAADEGCR